MSLKNVKGLILRVFFKKQNILRFSLIANCRCSCWKTIGQEIADLLSDDQISIFLELFQIQNRYRRNFQI